MPTRKKSEGSAAGSRRSIPRRQLLSDSIRLLAASGAVVALPAAASAAGAADASPGEQASRSSSRSGASRGAIQHLNPPTVSTPRGYSHAVVASGGKTVYISGQISLDHTGKLVGEGNLKAQAQQVFENIKAVVEAAGGTFADVVKLNFYMRDASQVQVVRDVRDTFIKADAPPASTLVEVRRLVREEFLLEVDAIAHIGTTV